MLLNGSRIAVLARLGTWTRARCMPDVARKPSQSRLGGPVLTRLLTPHLHKLLVKDNAWARLEQAWLSKRCLMQRGCTVEAEPLIKALHPIPLLPQVWTQRATASCNCGDFASHSWCKHVAALGYHLIDTCGAQPFYLCHLRQFDLDGLLRSRLPRKRARDSRSDEVIALLSDDEESDSGTRHGASCNNPIVL